MAGVFGFMDSPLVIWVQSFCAGGGVDFVDITEGIFLNDVLTQIDQRDLMPELNRSAKDVNGKLQNWEIFNTCIKQFYQEILQQVIVLDLPDILMIVKDSTKDCSLAELRKALLLLLGAAVQCDRKEYYINAIKQQDLDVQAAIVESIKEITENASNVLSLETPSETEDDYKVMRNNIMNLVDQRDKNYQALVQVTQERNYWRAEVDTKAGPVSPPVFLETHHLVRELNKHKEQTKKLSEEVEDKSKQLEVIKTDLQEKNDQLGKLKSENFQLMKDARTARSYRDELDMYKEMASKTEKYEKEILKYKETLNEMTFYKSRVEELRDDNTMLCESRATMEAQSEATQKKADSLMQDLLRAQGQLDELNAEKISDQKTIQSLLEDLSAMEFEKNNMQEGYTGPIRRMISYASAEFLHGSQLQLSVPTTTGHSISDELSDSMASKAMKTELENQELKRQLEEAKNQLNELQQELHSSKQKQEVELKQKLEELEIKTKEAKVTAQRELDRLYKDKTAKLEKEDATFKQRLTNNYNERVQDLQRRNRDIEGQVKHMEELWRKDKEKCISLEGKCKAVVHEKEQYKQKADHVTKTCENMEQMWRKDKDRFEITRKQHRDLQREKEVYKQQVDSVTRASEERVKQLEHDIENLTVELENATLENDNLKCTCSRTPTNEFENNNHINSYHDPTGFSKQQGVSCNMGSQKSTPSNMSNGCDSCTPDIMNLSYSSTISAPAGYVSALTPQKRESSSRIRTAGTPQQDSRQQHSSYQSSSVDAKDDIQNMWYTETLYRLGAKNSAQSQKQKYESDSTLDGYTSDASSQAYDTQTNHSNVQMRQAQSLKRGVVAPIRRGLPLESDYMAQMRASMPVQKLSYIEPPEKPEPRRSVSPKRSSTLNRSESFRHHSTKKDKSLSRSETFHVSPEEKQKSKSTYKIFKGLLGGKPKDSKESSSPASHKSGRDKHIVTKESSALASHKSDISDREKHVVRTDPTHLRSHRDSEREKHLCSKHKHDHEYLSPRGDHGRYANYDEFSNPRKGSVNSATDSGRASPESSRHNSSTCSIQTDMEGEGGHFLTSIKVVTTDTVRTTQTRLFALPRNSANWKYLVDRIVELQTRNQKLAVDHTEMRRTLNSVTFDGDRLSRLEARNLELEIESKKLNKIIAMLQGGYQCKKNPNDDKEYHYWTAC